MKNGVFIFFVFLLISLSSCSKFTKLQKENDLDKKYDGALEYYKEEEFLKASILLEELIPLVRGTNKSENVLYYHAKSTYNDRDFILANYYFKNFVKTFPNSQYAEECAFLSSLCLVRESPNFSLDQSDTKKAIDELQLFLDRYPQSDKKDSINVMVKDLRAKLEKKAYEGARQYYHIRRYKSAVIALKNALREYPDSRYREEMMYLIVASQYELAINSIESKKEERLLDTIESYNNFADSYSSSDYMKQAEDWYDNALKALETLRANN
ncbi:MAG: outer membrane protein assembly factor BamD [Flavobacteriales bacterium]|nr:outer membrane protein assembly factor BamD [Flavobacteriales bacterium]NNK80070.1 outer membrane protein assembly factor BamD [Flavobacteriales bacterium]